METRADRVKVERVKTKIGFDGMFMIPKLGRSGGGLL
ncbi:hypothetical protein OROGR_031198 [Orobanche gracilis]